MRQPVSNKNLTDSAIRQVHACLSVGASLKDAAEYIGVPVAVIQARRRKNPKFARGLRQAIHQGKVFHLNKIRKSPAWQASAWVLERRWRKQFGRNEPGDQQAAAQPEIYDWDRLTVEQQRQLIRFLRLALLSRAEARQALEASASDGGIDKRSLPAPAAGADRGGAVPAEPE